MIPTFFACAIALFAATPPVTMPVHVVAPWTLEVGPGNVTLGGRNVVLNESVRLEIAPSMVEKAVDEKYDAVPVFNAGVPGWVKGVCVRPLKAQECSGTGLLTPGSLRLKKSPGATEAYVLGKDYAVDEFWATFGRVEGGSIGENQPVYADYEYVLNRLDTIALDKAGKLHVLYGKPSQAIALPPVLPEGDTAIANVFVSGEKRALTDDNLFPIDASLAPAYSEITPVAEKLLPKTLAKLRAGEAVTIVAFGDSVTGGGGVNTYDESYQAQFAKLLQARFPKASVKMLTAAWGGANSQMFLDAPRGSEHDFVANLIEPKPDLVTIEFVNDAYFDEAGVAKHYGGLLSTLRENGSEVVLITPHLVRPDWLKADSLKFDDDPRPYVRGLRQFGEANNVAVADASAEWCKLWRRGLPYTTLLGNAINHPDVRGHELFAQVLMGLFPEK